MKWLKFNVMYEILVLALVFAFAFFIVYRPGHEIANVFLLKETPPQEYGQKVLKVMTYNIAHGRGHLSMYDKSVLGRNFHIKSQKEVTDRLDKIAELVKGESIDILILEEVDFDSSWSYHVDEAKYIANKAGFSNVVEGYKWAVNVPYLRIMSGTAILSKYPIVGASNKKFESEFFWRRFIGGHSYLSAVYMVNGRPIKVIGTHLDSDSDEAREKEAEELVRVTRKTSMPAIIGGDLNSVMPETKAVNEKMRNKFPDRTLDTFVESGLYDLDASKLRPNDEDMFTYSAENPHRIIDFIFPTKDIEVTEYYVVREDISDHYPLTARVIV